MSEQLDYEHKKCKKDILKFYPLKLIGAKNKECRDYFYDCGHDYIELKFEDLSSSNVFILSGGIYYLDSVLLKNFTELELPMYCRINNSEIISLPRIYYPLIDATSNNYSELIERFYTEVAPFYILHKRQINLLFKKIYQFILTNRITREEKTVSVSEEEYFKYYSDDNYYICL